jgi:Tfp pilus assembly protein PilO
MPNPFLISIVVIAVVLILSWHAYKAKTKRDETSREIRRFTLQHDLKSAAFVIQSLKKEVAELKDKVEAE